MIIYSSNYLCCGSTDYDPRSEACGYYKVLSKISGTACCGTDNYNPSTSVCCNGNILARSSGDQCSGSRNYNSFSHVCCSRKIQTKQPAGGHTTVTLMFVVMGISIARKVDPAVVMIMFTTRRCLYAAVTGCSVNGVELQQRHFIKISWYALLWILEL